MSTNLQISKNGGWGRFVFLLLLGAVSVAVIVGVPYVVYLDKQITARFEGKRWELPARVYGRALELYPGKRITRARLEEEFQRLNYIKVDKDKAPASAGEYRIDGGQVDVVVRGFDFLDERKPAQHLKFAIEGEALSAISDAVTRQPVSLTRLDPVLIANIYPQHNEDRVLVKLDQVPEFLIQSLLTIEDKAFYQHAGVRPLAILRAMTVNVREGRTVQGGSTLTQQLVKNLFLTNERSIARKLNEAIMSLLIEWHYSKEEILEAYLNEIYLGQEGSRAIHGFGLASQFYFGRNLEDLKPEQIALLVAIVKGPSYYEPRRHPDRVKVRRDVVLHELAVAGLITAEQDADWRQRDLGVTETAPASNTRFPAFLQLVREQLKRDYRDEDLRSEGLRIFTTLDPQVQKLSEEAVSRQVKQIEQDHRMQANTLEASMVVGSVDQGEILAVVGGREPRFDGYNHVTQMRRQIGSLVKPAVYLTALARPGDYNLVTPLDDTPLKLKQPNGEFWEPKNYDHQNHDRILLIDGLVSSYNVATARLGIDLGMENVVHTLQALGIEGNIPPYPSLTLGALELSPLEVLQMYQIIAANGYRTTLRSILGVVNQQGETLQRYPLAVQQVIPPEADYLLNTALMEVATRGTAKGLKNWLPDTLTVAGKTGTTNDLRDSWFAGFSGEHVAVAWVGRDDNGTTGLQGANGALRVWADTFSRIDTQPFVPIEPDALEWHQVSRSDGVVLAEDCSGGEWMPFIPGSLRQPVYSCQPGASNPGFQQNGAEEEAGAAQDAPARGGIQWLKGLINGR